MIKFAQKQYTEYDAMRSLYVELMKNSNRTKFEIIDRSSLIPVLKGNSVVIERFVISTPVFGRDRYRMYIKIGAKAKLPDEVRLAQRHIYDRKLMDLSLQVNGAFIGPKQENFSNNKNNNNNKKIHPLISTNGKSFVSFNQEVNELLGKALIYDKKERLLVLEFKTIYNAIEALNILPFGLNYKIYLLDS